MKNIQSETWAFDCEWVPSIPAGKAIYNLPADCPDEDVLQTMWNAAGATEENPRPFLKIAYCRVVSIAAVRRRVLPNSPQAQLSLIAIPEHFDEATCREASILDRFLNKGVSRYAPALVGYNSRSADLRILLQRALVNGISTPDLYVRLNRKPWESTDIDLMEAVCGLNRSGLVSLNDLARLCGIPGKLEMSGTDVCGAWFRGEREQIVQYNCFDALTTYLLWLRFEYSRGNLNDEEYRAEQLLVKDLLEREIENGKLFLGIFLDAWKMEA